MVCDRRVRGGKKEGDKKGAHTMGGDMKGEGGMKGGYKMADDKKVEDNKVEDRTVDDMMVRGSEVEVGGGRMAVRGSLWAHCRSLARDYRHDTCDLLGLT